MIGGIIIKVLITVLQPTFFLDNYSIKSSVESAKINLLPSTISRICPSLFLRNKEVKMMIFIAY